MRVTLPQLLVMSAAMFSFFVVGYELGRYEKQQHWSSFAGPPGERGIPGPAGKDADLAEIIALANRIDEIHELNAKEIERINAQIDELEVLAGQLKTPNSNRCPLPVIRSTSK